MLEEIKSIPYLLNGQNPRKINIREIRTNKLSGSNTEREYWLKSSEMVMAALNELDIDYVVINFLDIPYTYMRDIDILVENEADRVELKSFLEKMGCIASRYSSIYFFTDKKITYICPETKIEIDIYPRLAWSWWKIPYSPKGLITQNKVRTALGQEYVYVPSHTLDLYSTIVHSHAHSKISLAEVAYVTKLILNHNEVINWNDILFLVKRCGIEHTFYIYLLLANIVLKNLGRNFSNIQTIINALSKQFMCRYLNNYLYKKMPSQRFPIHYPFLIRFLSILKEYLFAFLL